MKSFWLEARACCIFSAKEEKGRRRRRGTSQRDGEGRNFLHYSDVGPELVASLHLVEAMAFELLLCVLRKGEKGEPPSLSGQAAPT